MKKMLLIGFVLVLTGCSQVSNENVQLENRLRQELKEKELQLKQEKSVGFIEEKKNTEAESNMSYSLLRQWNRGDIGGNGRPTTSTGFEILLSANLEKQEIIEIIQNLSKKDVAVMVKVFSTKEAYREDGSFEFTDNYKKGYILYFSKSPNANKDGQITWMQEIGKFQNLYGKKEQLGTQ